MTSPSSIAWQTPTAVASCPIATWRNPGSSPARKRSSTFSSNRRIRSISRRNSRRVSWSSTRLFSTFATEEQCTFCAVSLAGDWRNVQARLPEGWKRVELRLEARSPGMAERAAALLGPAQPFRATPTALRFASSRTGDAPSPDAVTRLLRRVDQARIAGRLELAGSEVAAPVEQQAATLLVDGWRRVLRAQLRLERLHRAGRRAVRAAQPAAGRHPFGDALPQRTSSRLRRGTSDGRALPRPLRRGRVPRLGRSAARAQRHVPRRNAGPDLVRGGRQRLMADPVSWLVIEPGWRVTAADGPQLGWVDKVLGDESLDIFHGLSVAGGRLELPRYVKSEQVEGIVNGLV